MKKLILTLIILLGATGLSAQSVSLHEKAKAWLNNNYCGMADAASIGIIFDERLLFEFSKYNSSPDFTFIQGFSSGTSKIEEANTTYSFNGFTLTDAKVLVDATDKRHRKMVIANMGPNMFIGRIEQNSSDFKHAILIPSDYVARINDIINQAISKGILISYLKPAPAPQETQPVQQQQQQRPSRPTTGSTQKRK